MPHAGRTGDDKGVLVILAPGQGAQTPGFLTGWLQVDVAAAELARLSEVSGLDLVRHGTVSDADTIRDTAIAQPLLVAAAIATARALFQAHEPRHGNADLLAGHSVGEISAAALTGVLSVEDAMVFVRERGQAMAAAAAVTPTGMSAVVGGKPDEVLARIAECGLTAANNNGAGQIVAAGTLDRLQQLAGQPPTRARVIPLQVAGAFHTAHMAPARVRLAGLATTLTSAAPATGLLSNRDGRVIASGTEYLDRLVDQVTNPVRWDLCLQAMADHGATGVLELAPAGTLTGIVKRNLPGVARFNLNTPDQLDDARDFCTAHAGTRRGK